MEFIVLTPCRETPAKQPRNAAKPVWILAAFAGFWHRFAQTPKLDKIRMDQL
jgi:hypothetical protein